MRTQKKSLERTETFTRLREIPSQGHCFEFSQDSGELDSRLKDLIGTNTYQVRIEIVPIGNAFELRGQLETQLDVHCSLCAEPLKHPINEILQDILLIQDTMSRAEHQVRVNHTTELAPDAPDYVVLTDDFFDLAEYVHEQIALAEPLKPVGSADCRLTCERFQAIERQGFLQQTGAEQDEFEKSKNPFQRLKNFKFNS